MITIRQFWEAVLFYVGLLAFTLLLAFTQGTVFMQQMPKEDPEEDAFIMRVESIDPRTVGNVTDTSEAFGAVNYRYNYASFEEMINEGKPNFVVRCEAVAREDMTVYDPLGYWDEALLWKTPTFLAELEEQQAAATHIATPYTMEIKDVLLGNYLQKGDTFTFYANYGFVNQFYMRYEHYPIYRVGDEYIMFLEVTKIAGREDYINLIHPAGAVRIPDEDPRSLAALSDLSDRIYMELDYDLSALEDTLDAIYASHPYDLSVPTITPTK